MNELAKEIKNMINISKEPEEKISILIKKLNEEKPLYSYKDNEKIVSASVIKVPIMLSALEEVRKGNISLDDKITVTEEDILKDTEVFENGEGEYSLYELINWMIIESDNTATNVIIKLFGMEKINNYIFKELELKSTYLERYMLDKDAIEKGYNNYTSQLDMYHVFEKLFNKLILNKDLCNIAIEILYNQRCQNQIMRHIYQKVLYAHKTGSLDYLNHDVGVMNINNTYFYIGISLYNSKNKKGNRKLIGNLGKIIYDYLSNL